MGRSEDSIIMLNKNTEEIIKELRVISLKYNDVAAKLEKAIVHIRELEKANIKLRCAQDAAKGEFEWINSLIEQDVNERCMEFIDEAELMFKNGIL